MHNTFDFFYMSFIYIYINMITLHYYCGDGTSQAAEISKMKISKKRDLIKEIETEEGRKHCNISPI